MFLKLFVCGFLIAISVLQVSPGQAQQKIRMAVPVIHGLAEITPQGQLQGVLKRTLEQMKRQTGQEISLEILPFRRILALIQSNEVDLGLFIENEERNQLAHLTQRLYQINFVLVSKKDADIKERSDLKGKIVGYSRRGVSKELLSQIDGASFLKFSHPKNLISALMIGKIDAFFTPDYRWVEMIETKGLNYADYHVSLLPKKRFLALYASHQFKQKQPELWQVLKAQNNLSLTGFGTEVLGRYYGTLAP